HWLPLLFQCGATMRDLHTTLQIRGHRQLFRSFIEFKYNGLYFPAESERPKGPFIYMHGTLPLASQQNTSHKDNLLARIAECKATVAIIGMGYVGLPLSVCVAKIGFPVIGVDVNSERVEQISRGESYINDVTEEELRPLVQAGRIRATQ